MQVDLYRGKGEYVEGWVYGYLVKGTWYLGDTNHNIIVPVGTVFYPHCEISGWESVYPNTLGRFIGRCDKNGTKIFEGDVVKTKYGRLCEVIWFESNQFIGWDLKPVNNFDDINHNAPDIYDMWRSENLEVVGNIYDSLEFAKGE